MHALVITRKGQVHAVVVSENREALKRSAAASERATSLTWQSFGDREGAHSTSDVERSYEILSASLLI